MIYRIGREDRELIQYASRAAARLMEQLKQTVEEPEYFNEFLQENDFEDIFSGAVTCPDYGLFVKLENNAPRGFILGRVRDRRGILKLRAPTGSIDMCWVDPEFRNSGIGESLVHSLERWLAGAGVKTVENYCLIGNYGGLKFWRDCGYEPYRVGHRKIIAGIEKEQPRPELSPSPDL